jgi:F-type H+-transporting ATPase subunit delta
VKSLKQAQREARRLFHLCLVDASLDERRVRRVVESTIRAGRHGRHAVLSRLHRLLRLYRAAHSAEVESAAALPRDLAATIERGLAVRYGPDLVTSFTSNPALIGGLRIRVGSDVYDGSVRARLASLEERL